MQSKTYLQLTLAIIKPHVVKSPFVLQVRGYNLNWMQIWDIYTNVKLLNGSKIGLVEQLISISE